MNQNMDGRTKKGKTWRRVVPVALLFLSVALIAGLLKPVTAGDRNVIQNIKTVGSEVEIELTSERSFPVRDELVVLRIGSKEFSKSRSPDDGSLNTLIFSLKTDEFAQTNTGDRVVVQYGRGETNDRWDFGTLDKDRLDK